MKVSGVLICLLFFPLFLHAQDSCSYIKIRPDTFYINQYIDTVLAEEFVYTGGKDISYSTCYFRFSDSAEIDIDETATTTGVAGPFIFSRFGGYKIIYKQDSIARNTIVHGYFGVYDSGSGAPVIDCQVPITVAINAGLVPEPPGKGPLSVYPNPVFTTAVLKMDKAFKNATVIIYNSVGQNVFRADNITSGFSASINCRGLSSGAYVVTVFNGGEVCRAHMQIDAHGW